MKDLKKITDVISISGNYREEIEYDHEIKVVKDVDHEYIENYSKITIYENSTNKIIHTFNRNESPLCVFKSKYFMKNNNEYYVGFPHYTTQIFINLNTKEVFNQNHELDDQYLWCDMQLTNDEKFLIVDGCYWAFPYGFNVYDISDLKNGWKCVYTFDDDVELFFTKNYIYEIKKYNQENLYLILEKMSHDFTSIEEYGEYIQDENDPDIQYFDYYDSSDSRMKKISKEEIVLHEKST